MNQQTYFDGYQLMTGGVALKGVVDVDDVNAFLHHVLCEHEGRYTVLQHGFADQLKLQEQRFTRERQFLVQQVTRKEVDLRDANANLTHKEASLEQALQERALLQQQVAVLQAQLRRVQEAPTKRTVDASCQTTLTVVDPVKKKLSKAQTTIKKLQKANAKLTEQSIFADDLAKNVTALGAQLEARDRLLEARDRLLEARDRSLEEVKAELVKQQEVIGLLNDESKRADLIKLEMKGQNSHIRGLCQQIQKLKKGKADTYQSMLRFLFKFTQDFSIQMRRWGVKDLIAACHVVQDSYEMFLSEKTRKFKLKETTYQNSPLEVSGDLFLQFIDNQLAETTKPTLRSDDALALHDDQTRLLEEKLQGLVKKNKVSQAVIDQLRAQLVEKPKSELEQQVRQLQNVVRQKDGIIAGMHQSVSKVGKELVRKNCEIQYLTKLVASREFNAEDSIRFNFEFLFAFFSKVVVFFRDNCCNSIFMCNLFIERCWRSYLENPSENCPEFNVLKEDTCMRRIITAEDMFFKFTKRRLIQEFKYTVFTNWKSLVNKPA